MSTNEPPTAAERLIIAAGQRRDGAAPSPNAEPTDAEVEWLREHVRERVNVVGDELRADAITLRLIDAWAARRPSPPAVAFDEAGIEALARVASDADPDLPAVSHGVLRAVATAVAEAVFVAMEMHARASEADSPRAQQGIRRAIAEARRSLRIPTPVEAPKVASLAEMAAILNALLDGLGAPACDSVPARIGLLAQERDDAVERALAAVESDRAAVRAAIRSALVDSDEPVRAFDAACRAVDGKAPLASTDDQPRCPSCGLRVSGDQPIECDAYKAPPVAVAPSVVEEIARVICNAYVMVETNHIPEKHWLPEARAVLAHLAARLTGPEAVEAARRPWALSRSTSDIPSILAAVARVVFGEAKAGEPRPSYGYESRARLEDDATEAIATWKERDEARAERADVAGDLTAEEEAHERTRAALDEARAERDAATKRAEETTTLLNASIRRAENAERKWTQAALAPCDRCGHGGDGDRQNGSDAHCPDCGCIYPPHCCPDCGTPTAPTARDEARADAEGAEAGRNRTHAQWHESSAKLTKERDEARAERDAFMAERDDARRARDRAQEEATADAATHRMLAAARAEIARLRSAPVAPELRRLVEVATPIVDSMQLDDGVGWLMSASPHDVEALRGALAAAKDLVADALASPAAAPAPTWVIRSQGEYLGPNDGPAWTDRPEDARTFDAAADAYVYARHMRAQGLTDAEAAPYPGPLAEPTAAAPAAAVAWPEMPVHDPGDDMRDVYERQAAYVRAVCDVAKRRIDDAVAALREGGR